MKTSDKIQLGPLECSPHTISDLLNDITELIEDKHHQPRTILCVNAHIYNVAMKNPRLLRVLNQTAITAADGMALVWAARFLGRPIASRCNMTEAFRAFLHDKQMPPTTAILVGMSDAEAAETAKSINATQKHCNVIATASGFLDDNAYADLFRRHSNVDLILLGMSTPRTEFTAELASSVCPRAVVWGIGAGTIRIYAGTMNEAPLLLRRLGLQWLHRLCTEPRALWKRYLIGNPQFALHILKARLRRKPHH